MSTLEVARLLVVLVLLASVLSACGSSSATAPATPKPSVPAMPNPAAQFCVEQGGRSEIRTAADGSQAGYCLFPDGSECDEWAYYRGECAPGGTTPLPSPYPAD